MTTTETLAKKLLQQEAPAELLAWSAAGAPAGEPADGDVPYQYFEVHYTPIGRELVDRSSLALIFTDEPPEHEVHEDFVYMRELTIPAGNSHYRLTNTYKFQQPSRILSLTPHMHVRGKHWRFELEYPDGKRESVLTVPRWDFDWQGVYRFERPIPVPRGTRLLATAHYDNSAFNPNNPDPTVDVSWGPQSWYEMMNFRVTYVVDE